MRNQGFTVVELVITITIMGILMTIGVAGFVNTQANSRDAERKADIEAIALHLENFYKYGSTTSGGAIIEGGQYPYVNIEDSSITGCATTLYAQSVLRDIDKKSMLAPGHDALQSTCDLSSNNQAVSINDITIDNYLYQPLTETGEVCQLATDVCRSYNLYYMTETDTSNSNPSCDKDTKICRIESQNQ